MLRFDSIENNEPRMKEGDLEIAIGTILAPNPDTPNLVRPAKPGDQVVGISMEEIRVTDNDFSDNRRIATDFPVNDSDEFEAVVIGAVASSDFENQTFDVSGDVTDDLKSQKVDISTPGTQFTYMRTTGSSDTVQEKNTAIFRFNRSNGAQITS